MFWEKGGSITWKPTDPYTNSSTVEVIIYQTHSWTLSRLNCNQTVIDTLGPYLDGGSFYGEPDVACRPNATSCTGSGWTLISEPTFCTDFSLAVQISSGALIRKRVLNRNTNILVGFARNTWADEIRTGSGAQAIYWSVTTRIDLTQKYPINSSPGNLFPIKYLLSFQVHSQSLDLCRSFVLSRVKRLSFKSQQEIGMQVMIFVAAGQVMQVLQEANVRMYVITYLTLLSPQG